jgi:hypothetical protein
MHRECQRTNIIQSRGRTVRGGCRDRPCASRPEAAIDAQQAGLCQPDGPPSMSSDSPVASVRGEVVCHATATTCHSIHLTHSARRWYVRCERRSTSRRSAWRSALYLQAAAWRGLRAKRLLLRPRHPVAAMALVARAESARSARNIQWRRAVARWVGVAPGPPLYSRPPFHCGQENRRVPFLSQQSELSATPHGSAYIPAHKHSR